MTGKKILAVIAVLVLFSLACGLTNTISSGVEQVATLAGEAQSLATSAAGAIPPGVLDDPRTYLLDALRQQMMSLPYRATMTQVTPDETLNYTVEFQPPDRFHMVMPGVVEGIVIGEIFYLKQGEQWMQVPMSGDYTSAFGLLGPDTESMFDAIQNVEFAGADFLNGVPTLVFTYTSDATVAGIVSTSTDKLWLGATDGRVHQIVVEGEAAGIHSTTTIVYEYDPSIVVEEPN